MYFLKTNPNSSWSLLRLLLKACRQIHSYRYAQGKQRGRHWVHIAKNLRVSRLPPPWFAALSRYSIIGTKATCSRNINAANHLRTPKPGLPLSSQPLE
uniref:Uncharacterized protein n=1 Tax=Physcomitrium patens TaxID=3218 RepID=A0A7I4CJR6_PHYPA